MLIGKQQILVVDDEANLRRVLAAQLTRDGYEVHTAEDGEQALEFIKEHHVDLVISDLRMPKLSGMDLLRWTQSEEPKLPVVILTAHATVDTAVEALKIGAVDYISKPFDQDEVRRLVRKALQVGELSHRDATHPGARDLPEGTRYGIIGSSKGVRDLYALVERVAATPTTVLVTGESGTGKELVARALHEHSGRANRPFIKVNCAAIPKTLMESELFGYEKGAFTGAVTSKPGRFELAQGGTLFLDEIGEIPLEMQVKLLRVLQESEFERVGGLKTIRVDVRLVTATNRDLRREIAAGRFREDLFYRLNVVPIDLPPLRDRSDDIPMLVSFFIAKFNARLGKRLEGIDDEALRVLTRYRWPGNVRELENIMERAILFADGERISALDLPPEIVTVEGDPSDTRGADPAANDKANLEGGGLREGRETMRSESKAGDAQFGEGLKEQVRAAAARIERELIVRALKQTHGNVTHAARLLKISRKGLQLKMKELDLRERE
jgi:nitrogen regulation protein NR(I)